MSKFVSYVVLSGLTVALLAGCGRESSMPVTTNQQELPTKSETSSSSNSVGESSESGHGHSHERGKMLIADAGTMHALLTAHLAKEGNELDIFLETPVSKNPQPIAIAVESFEAVATSGDGESQTLVFEPAPADERPANEKDGCSHFVAKANWMKPTDSLLVVAKFIVDGKEVVARWKDFEPQKYAHHVE